MATKVHMEALSPTMEEGQLVRWLKAEGDSVSNGEILAEIETDKATMELVARGDGVLRKILLGEGGTAPVGEVIAVIGGADEDISALVGAGEVAVATPPAPTAEGTAVASPTPGEAEPAVGAPAVEAPAVEAPAVEAPVTQTPSGKDAGGRVKASPLARRLAHDSSVDLSRVQGSGPGGRVVKRDVEAVTQGGSPLKGSPAPQTTPPLVARSALGDGPDFEDLPLSQMRKTIAKRLVESMGPVPHFFLRINVDMTRIMEARKSLNRLLEKEGEKVSINDFVLRATAQALFKHPAVNSQWGGDSVRRHYRVHLGVAVAVEDGLITPVVRDANLRGLVEISQEVRELALRGREKRLQPEEYTGSTFSVSNLGMFGIHEFTGIINPPEAGILAVGGIEETPVAEEGEVVVRPLMKVTMSCDHRVIDGATGAAFLQTLKGMLEEPAAILL
jgi:pyruvate dehydrogenase E2 component (dihydrolipoamide acetyltransferase)